MSNTIFSRFRKAAALVVGTVFIWGSFHVSLQAQDTTAPFVVSAVLDCQNDHRLNVTFSEPVVELDAFDEFNYYLYRNADPLAPYLPALHGIVGLSQNSTTFAVTFGPGSFIPDNLSILGVNSIRDLAGNEIDGDLGEARYPVEVCAIPEPSITVLSASIVGGIIFVRLFRRGTGSSNSEGS